MDYICTSCSYIGEQKRIKPGSTTVEILLWTILFFPGPFYTIWRILKRTYGCPKCGETVMIMVINKTGKKETNSLQSDSEAKLRLLETYESVIKNPRSDKDW